MFTFFCRTLILTLQSFFIIPLILYSPLYASKRNANFHPRGSTQHGEYLGYPRDYYTPVTPAQRECLRYIVTSLGNKSLVTIAIIRPQLEEAGDVIEGLHPLKFLHTVFSDEEMKVAIRNIRPRAWIWTSFMNGLKQSLITESNISNITLDHIRDFSESLGIDYRLVKREVDQKQWEGLVNLLIHLVPRGTDSRRYD